jgi:hypothetical protein
VTVYIDDYRASVGPMTVCLMVADTTDELKAMATALGIPRRHIEAKGKPGREYLHVRHYKREQAIALGAVPITHAALSRYQWRRLNLGRIIPPTDAQARSGAP